MMGGQLKLLLFFVFVCENHEEYKRITHDPENKQPNKHIVFLLLLLVHKNKDK